MAAPSLHWVDYIIFAVFMGGSLGIGIFHAFTGGKQKTPQEFIMANRQLKVLPTMMSLVASYYSAILILGCTAEFYNWGIQMWLLSGISNTIGLTLAERFIIPWLYALKLTSAFEYLQMRYKSRSVEILGTFIGILKGSFYMGIAIYAPSIALEAACGFPAKASIPLMALLCTAYTALGGMRAVIWTDVFQIVVMLAGMVAILIRGAVVVGGLGNALEYGDQHRRLEFNTIWNPDPRVRHTIWGFVIGNVPFSAVLFGVNQASVQRYSATKSLNQARWVVRLNIPAGLLLFAMATMTGIIAFAYYAMIECDPLANGEITTANQVLTKFVQTIFKDAIGFSGLFLATLYSGALSSVSSAQSGAAANTWENILKVHLPKMSDSKAALINKFLVIFYGLFAICLAFLASTMPGTVMQISFTLYGTIAGPLFALFLMGGLSSFVEWKGALCGSLAAMFMNIWVIVGSKSVPGVNNPYPPASTAGCLSPNITDVTPTYINYTMQDTPWVPYDMSRVSGLGNLYSISYIWYPFIGAITCMSVAFSVSAFCRYVLHEETEPVHPKLIIPWKAGFGLAKYPSEQEEIEDKDSKYKLNGVEYIEAKDTLLQNMKTKPKEENTEEA